MAIWSGVKGSFLMRSKMDMVKLINAYNMENGIRLEARIPFCSETRFQSAFPDLVIQLQVHALVKGCDLVAIAIEQQGCAAGELADAPL